MTEATMSFIRDDMGNPVSVLGVSRDITERKNAEHLIRKSLREKELLLREVHHRVKNNLQIIISFISLHLDKISNPQFITVIHDFEDRIRAMSIIHEQIYESGDLSRIDFSQFIAQVTSVLACGYDCESRHISFEINAERVMLDINHAIPCAIVVNEIITNSLKYAFPGKFINGIIAISLARVGDDVILGIKDNGVGISPEIDTLMPEHLGFRIIRMTVVNQLKGVVDLRRGNGTEFYINFPIV